MRWSNLLPLTLALVSVPASAAGPQLYGGALDPVTAGLAVGLGGLALWRAKGRATPTR